MRSYLGLAIGIIAACSSHHDAGPDAGGGACSGTDTQCNGVELQTCTDGTFVTTQTCSGSILVSLCGCVDCDPSMGNTCNGSDAVTCNADGSFGSTIMTCGEGTACSAGTCDDACTADGVDLVYVVDESNDFLSFDPRKLPGDPFTMIGVLDCPHNNTSIEVPAQGVIPFSMSIDRNGKAWVLYASGELFNVSLTDASCTAVNNVIGAGGMELFGMGFSTDSVGGNTEHLFIAGGGQSAQPMGKLADIDTTLADLTPTVLGTLTAASDYSPELTGTSEAKLFGFYPVLTTGPAYVQEIDKTSGAPVGQVWNLGTSGLGSAITDWAFAQWGGVFYVFVTTADSSNTRTSTVRAIDRATNTYSVVLPNVQYFIDGAGVSTCAPITIQ